MRLRMKKALGSENGVTSLQVGIAVALAFLLFSVLTILLSRESSNRLQTAFERSAEKSELVQTMKNELLASAVYEKSSVMADTDKESKALAEESMQASQRVEEARVKLSHLLEKNSREAAMLHEFGVCWEKLREIDKKVISLAVQNTNLKAFRLSFGPAAEAVRKMEDGLNQLMDSAVSRPNGAEIIRVAARAQTGALNIYALQAPHIAETTDAGMDRIESDMKRVDEQVRNGLSQLDALVGNWGKPSLAQAEESYQEFQKINAEIIDLSRQNSNVLSASLSLGQKRNQMAECMDRLNGLQQAIREGATIHATR